MTADEKRAIAKAKRKAFNARYENAPKAQPKPQPSALQPRPGPVHVTPRAHTVIRTNGTVQMVSTTDKRYAVGSRLRTGEELPVCAELFATQAEALVRYQGVANG